MKQIKYPNKLKKNIFVFCSLFGLFGLFFNSFFDLPIFLEIIGFLLAYFGALSYFIYFDKGNYFKAIKFIKQLKFFILFTTCLFILGILSGFLFEFTLLTDLIKKMIEQILNQSKNLGFLGMFWFIFKNNSFVAFFSIFLGLFFAVFPIITTVFNGYVIGFILKKSIAVDGLTVFFKLIPHGIFELPAIILSISLGLKIGMFLFNKNFGDDIRLHFKESLRVFLFAIIPLLIIAAIIETILIFLFK